MSSSIDNVMAMLAPLTLDEKLRFLTTFTADFAKTAKKEAKKSGKRSSKDKDTDKPKRKTAPATYAWLAYPKELEKSHPELFEGLVHMPERLKIVKSYKAEHPEEYEAYKAKYLEDLASGAITPPVQKERVSKKKSKGEPSLLPSDAEDEAEVEAEASEVEAPPPAPESSGKEKLEKMKKKMAEKKDTASSSSNAAPSASPPSGEKPTKAKRVSVAKKAKAAAAEPKPEEGQEFITVDGKNYIKLLENNGCFARNDNGTFGAWVGIYDEETNTIRETASPSDE